MPLALCYYIRFADVPPTLIIVSDPSTRHIITLSSIGNVGLIISSLEFPIGLPVTRNLGFLVPAHVIDSSVCYICGKANVGFVIPLSIAHGMLCSVKLHL